MFLKQIKKTNKIFLYNFLFSIYKKCQLNTIKKQEKRQKEARESYQNLYTEEKNKKR